MTYGRCLLMAKVFCQAYDYTENEDHNETIMTAIEIREKNSG